MTKIPSTQDLRYQIEYLKCFIERWNKLDFQLNDSANNEEDLLTDEYQRWLKWQELPIHDADELLYELNTNLAEYRGHDYGDD